MRKALILIAVLAALPASPAATERRLTKSARLAPGESSEVTIVSPCGSVSVRAAPGDEVRVDATITDEAVGVDLMSGSNGKSITVSLTGSPSSPRGCAQLDVTVPPACSVRVYGATEPVKVEAAPGMRIVDASSRDGDVRVTGTAMAVSAASFSGSVLVQGTFAAVTARTATGLITVEGKIGEVDTDTLSGFTLMTCRDLGRGTAKSVSGSIWVKAAFRDPAPLNTLSVESGAGSFRLGVHPGLEARYNLSARDPGDRSSLVAFSPSILATAGEVTITADGSMTVNDSGALTVSGRASVFEISHWPSSITTGSDLTRISLTSTTGTISIEPWEEAQP